MKNNKKLSLARQAAFPPPCARQAEGRWQRDPSRSLGFVWAPGLEKLPKKGQHAVQNSAKMKPNTCQNGPQMGPRRWPGGPKSGEKTASQQKGREHATDPPFLAEKVANMARTWAPRWSQNRTKIDTKINQKNHASWDRFLEGFWKIFGRKMDACWHQTRIENRALRKYEKSHLELAR